MPRGLDIQSHVIRPRKIDREFDMIRRRGIDYINRISDCTTRRGGIWKTGIVIHVIPRRAYGVILVEREATPHGHDFSAAGIEARA